MEKIVFFGNSLVAGYGLKDPASESLPALIDQKLKQHGMNFQVVNAGISGDTTASALSWIARSLQGGIAIFIIELGANDFLRGIAPSLIYDNLQSIISRVKSECPRASILIPGIALPQWAHMSHGRGYGGIYEKLARENNTAIVPSFLKNVSGKRALNMPDGVHPLAPGYQIASETFGRRYAL
ncbi:GDSL-type esterase/lipase family protein [Pedobacter psychrodurus]|uniref:GDSL-type esterase/lipase family protein n=1 Tax=Pedobacter psychrodurus TaxID=2530456 RepID=UPI0029302B4D|nr:GDSL-type esterase/lipase family protein [Pedobacter psychrodurus]